MNPRISVFLTCVTALILAAGCRRAQPPVNRDIAPKKVLFIGLDGGSWDFIEPMLEDGQLPNFRKLLDGAAYGALESTWPSVTPPGWTSMFTGKNPGKTGVYGFAQHHVGKYAFDVASSRDVRCATIWDAVSSRKRTAGIVCLPMSFPCAPLNGVAVGGIMTPFAYTRGRTVTVTLPGASGHGAETRRISCFNRRFIVENSPDGPEVHLRFETPLDDRGTHVLTLHPGGDTPWIPVVVAPEAIHVLVREYAPQVNTKNWRAWVKIRLEKRSETSATLVISPAIYDLADLPYPVTYPPELARDIRNIEPCFAPTHIQFDDDTDIAFIRGRGRVARRLYLEKPWDFFAVVYHRSDSAGHTSRIEFIRRVYKVIDDELGRWMDILRDDTFIVMASDHGFCKKTWRLDLNLWLKEIGLMTPGKPSDEGFDPGSSRIDYSRTKVYHRMWGLYFNLAGRDPMGQVQPGSGERRLVAYLEEKARELNEKAGFQLLKLAPASEIYSGKYMESAPDIVPIVDDACKVNYWELARQERPLVAVRKPLYGHAHDGIFIVWGPRVRHARLSTRSIYDITPTILYLMGLPLAKDFDGKPISDALEIPPARRTGTIDSYDPFKPALSSEFPAQPTSRHSEAIVKEQLKNLGYIN